jgi:hypothetical protein
MLMSITSVLVSIPGVGENNICVGEHYNRYAILTNTCYGHQRMLCSPTHMLYSPTHMLYSPKHTYVLVSMTCVGEHYMCW